METMENNNIEVVETMEVANSNEELEVIEVQESEEGNNALVIAAAVAAVVAGGYAAKRLWNRYKAKKALEIEAAIIEAASSEEVQAKVDETISQQENK